MDHDFGRVDARLRKAQHAMISTTEGKAETKISREKTVREIALERGVPQRVVERERMISRYAGPELLEAVRRRQISLALAETLCTLRLDEQAALASEGPEACLAYARRMRRRAEWRRTRDDVLAVLRKQRHVTIADEATRRDLANVIAAAIIGVGVES